MSSLGFTANVDELPQGNNNFEPLPAGWYTATISGAELRTTKAGNGQYISVGYTITGPTHEGRMVFGNINIQNPNPKAEEIGRQQLGDIMRAIGLTSVSDTDQLIGGHLQVKLSVRKSEEYGDSNETKGFKAVSGGSPAPATQAKPAAAAPPWQKQ